MKKSNKKTTVRVDFRGVTKPILTPQDWLDRKLQPADRILGDLFSTTSRVLFSADTGLGKTMLSMAWAVAMSLGRDFLHWKAHRPARVLYIDGEMPRRLMRERIEMACTWYGVTPLEARRVHFMSREDFSEMPPLDTPDGAQWLNEFMSALPTIDFIIFDNIMSLCSGIMKDEESWQAVKPFVMSLTERRIGQMWVHHVGHDKSRSYGTKTREWQMDTVIVGEATEEKFDVAMKLRFTKARQRTPVNRSDFDDTQVELTCGHWRSSAPAVSLNASEQIALQALRTASEVTDDGVPEQVWRQHAYDLNISKGEERARQQAFLRAKVSLVEKGVIFFVNNQYFVRA